MTRRGRSAEETVAALSRELDQTYRTVVANLPSNPGARVEQVDGKDELIVTPLDKLDEPDSLVLLGHKSRQINKIHAIDLNAYSIE